MDKGKRLEIKVENEPGEATPAQQAAWLRLWTKLLSEGQKQTDDAEKRGSKPCH